MTPISADILPTNEMDGPDIVRVKSDGTRPIYSALSLHQQTDDTWELRELLSWLQLWTERFICEFKLEIAEVSLCVDWLHWRRYGHFHQGHNGFGLVGEVALNRRHLPDRQPWQILGVLLHELLHAWQSVHGHPSGNNYHNMEFRHKARSLGLVVDHVGHTQYEPDSPFFDILRKYNIDFPEIPSLRHVPSSSTKLKKWSCCCVPPVNVRVAVRDFQAICLRCGQIFRRA